MVASWGREQIAALIGLLFVVCLLVSCASPSQGIAPETTVAPVLVQASPAATPTSPVTLAATATAAPPTATSQPTASPIWTRTAEPTKVPSTATPTTAPPLIAIDPGHGGRDLGARHFDNQGHMDFYEAEINLAVSLLLRDLLLERGYRVFMTRDADYGLNPEYLDLNGDDVADHVDELQTRLDMVNEQDADLLVSIHQNAFYTAEGVPAEDVGGLATFYCKDREFGQENLLLAQYAHAELLAAFGELGHDIYDRGVQDDLVLMTPDEPGTHLIVLGPTSDRIVRPSEMPGILSEPLFITHAQEAELIQRPEVQARLSLAFADAISAYLQDAQTRIAAN